MAEGKKGFFGRLVEGLTGDRGNTDYGRSGDPDYHGHCRRFAK